MKMRNTAAALFAAFLVGPSLAGTCDVDIEGNDAMQFNKTSIAVPASCKKFTVRLSYAWFCSFPGHAAIMKGTLALAK